MTDTKPRKTAEKHAPTVVGKTMGGTVAKSHYIMHVKHRYPEWVRPLLFGEIVGQRALAGHLTGGFTDRLFRQKAVFAPDSLVDLCVEQLTYDNEQTMRHST